MIRYYKKFLFIKVYENWFEYKYRFQDVVGINVYWNVKKQDTRKIPCLKKITHTVELDLTQDLDIIFSNFSKQIRQQSKAAENEGIICQFHQQVNEFVDFFNDFAAKKNTDMVSRRRIEEMGKDLKLSFAVHNGQILAAHSYLTDWETGMVRHQHSATRRLDENTDKNLIGRANKYLTVKNIAHFKEQGFKTFDFGGFAKDTNNESLKGINNYKLLFGGTVVSSVNYFSFSYWLLKKISHFVGLSGMV